jgi:hypothetical protein
MGILWKLLTGCGGKIKCWRMHSYSWMCVGDGSKNVFLLSPFSPSTILLMNEVQWALGLEIAYGRIF